MGRKYFYIPLSEEAFWKMKEMALLLRCRTYSEAVEKIYEVVRSREATGK